MKLKLGFFIFLFLTSFSIVFSEVENNFFLMSDVLDDGLSIDLMSVDSFYIDNYFVQVTGEGDSIIVDFTSDSDFKQFRFPIDKINVSETNFIFSLKRGNVEINFKNLDKFISEIKYKQKFVSGFPSKVDSFDILSGGREEVIIKFSDYYYDQMNEPNFEINSLGVLDYSFENESQKFNSEVLDRNLKELIQDVEEFGIYNGYGSSLDVVRNEYEIYGGVSSVLSLEEIDFLRSKRYVERIDLNNNADILVEDAKTKVGVDIVNSYIDNNGSKLVGEGIVVAVLDTGIDYEHEDFGSCSLEDYDSNSCSRFVKGYDFVNNDDDPMDDNGHGTHVAGIIGGNGSVVGVAPGVKFMPIKVMSKYGTGSFDDILSGIELAMDPNSDGNYSDAVDILSISLGGSGTPDDVLSQMVDLAISKGIVTVVAAGNSGPSGSTISSPGLSRDAITVGASCLKSQIGVNYYCYSSEIARFSSRGPSPDSSSVKPEIVAPGVDICATKSSFDSSGSYCGGDLKHVSKSGTSMATPLVSGIVALLLQKDSSLTPYEVKQILMTSANDIGGTINEQGVGEVDSKKAYSLIGVSTNYIVNESYVFFEGDFGNEYFVKSFKVQNIGSDSLNISLVLSNFTDGKGGRFSLGNLSVSNFSLGIGGEFVFNLSTNLSGIFGDFEGSLLINDSNDLTVIPIVLSRFVRLNLSLVDGIYSTVMSPESVYLFDGNESKGFIKDADNKYHLDVIPNNFSIFIFGYEQRYNLRYILMKDVEMLETDMNVIMNLNESRVYNVSGKSFDDKDLKTYEYDFGFYAYNDLSNESLSAIINDFDYYYGTQQFWISNKPNYVDNVDVVVKYEGVEQ